MSVLHVGKNNFEQEVLKSEKTVLMDFWASWCAPCRMIAPTLEEIAEEQEDIKVVKINVDEEPELANQFGITSIPALFVMNGGKITGQAVGVRPKASILKMIDE